ncbi:uncharacterized protein ACLA_007960 [Aspergillus clavatus NRRL 1]|uniref:F-box domain protein n=1 Tax=Aspergillus clavatus (strain ATCC 1007 / CBS 513.65 / DSM 816 / NCTC 3887 / NRRL 1 / QM 1276 / 107) TaxID=344612 RepID=A1CDV9_ASPCL|nr:uncharacterized protein ACLA_007960 [Aspergillus clavatus NRRL 1]EAW12036.1 conserved hypothetical protein [Aspergillus clavatus NRRL 1]
MQVDRIPTKTRRLFTDLPPEIRVLVYRYLIPNTDAETAHRLDREPCAPAMLRTNSMIYRELLQEWYSAIPYSLSIATPADICFTHQQFSPDNPLPSTLLQVSTLHLYINIVRSPQSKTPRLLSEGVKEESDKYRDRVEAVAQFLARPDCRLKRLRLVAIFNRLAYNTLRGSPENLHKALDFTLSPLRARRLPLGSQIWGIIICYTFPGRRSGCGALHRITFRG